jgi:hypothetical protein
MTGKEPVVKTGRHDIVSFIIGINAGVLGGLVGIGGGMVMIPLMVRFLALSQHQAHGTSLVAVIFTGLAGALTYAIHGSVNHVAAAILVVTSLVTVPLGARYAHHLSEKKLRKAFGIFLIIISGFMLMKPYLAALSVATSSDWKGVVILLATGSLTGFLAGMMGVGGGGLMIAVMVLLLGMGQHAAQGTSLAAMVPTALLGSWTHRKLGNVRRDIVVSLVAGVLIGTYIGGATAHLVPEAELRTLLCLVILWVGIRYVRAS